MTDATQSITSPADNFKRTEKSQAFAERFQAVIKAPFLECFDAIDPETYPEPLVGSPLDADNFREDEAGNVVLIQLVSGVTDPMRGDAVKHFYLVGALLNKTGVTVNATTPEFNEGNGLFETVLTMNLEELVVGDDAKVLAWGMGFVATLAGGEVSPKLATYLDFDYDNVIKDLLWEGIAARVNEEQLTSTARFYMNHPLTNAQVTHGKTEISIAISSDNKRGIDVLRMYGRLMAQRGVHFTMSVVDEVATLVIKDKHEIRDWDSIRDVLRYTNQLVTCPNKLSKSSVDDLPMNETQRKFFRMLFAETLISQHESFVTEHNIVINDSSVLNDLRAKYAAGCLTLGVEYNWPFDTSMNVNKDGTVKYSTFLKLESDELFEPCIAAIQAHRALREFQVHVIDKPFEKPVEFPNNYGRDVLVRFHSEERFGFEIIPELVNKMAAELKTNTECTYMFCAQRGKVYILPSA